MRNIIIIIVAAFCTFLLSASAHSSVDSYWFEQPEYENHLFEELKCDLKEEYCDTNEDEKRRVEIVRAVSREGVKPEVYSRPDCNGEDRPCNDQLVEWMDNSPQKYGDPIWPIIIGLHETGLDNSKGGDFFLSEGQYPVSCGMTQIRTDYDGRPSCYELRQDFRHSLNWTAEFLDYLLTKPRCATKGQCISRYGGIGRLMDQFEMWVVLVAKYSTYHFEEEQQTLSCLPFDESSVESFKSTL